MYRDPAFSTLSIVLHTLFISPAAALKISQSEAWRYLESRLRSPLGTFFLSISVIMIALFALLRDYNMVAYVWLLLMVWPLTIIALKGQPTPTESAQGRYLWSPLIGLAANNLARLPRLLAA